MFLWQFPHFMAIAWLYRDDYARGGQRMLTVVDPTGLRAGAQAVVAALVLDSRQPGARAVAARPAARSCTAAGRCCSGIVPARRRHAVFAAPRRQSPPAGCCGPAWFT